MYIQLIWITLVRLCNKLSIQYKDKSSHIIVKLSALWKYIKVSHLQHCASILQRLGCYCSEEFKHYLTQYTCIIVEKLSPYLYYMIALHFQILWTKEVKRPKRYSRYIHTYIQIQSLHQFQLVNHTDVTKSSSGNADAT